MRFKNPRVPILIAVAAILAAIFAVPASADSGEGRYIVVFKDSVSHPGALAADQADEVDADLSFVYRTALKGYAAVMPKDEVETLESDPRVDYVSPDRKVSVASQNMPTGTSRIFAPQNASLDIDETDDLRIDADVAVIDTGVDIEHPDLNVVSRTDCEVVNYNPSAGCIDGSGDDLYGHGTHVAGTIAAKDNGEGVVGVAPGARIWSVKVLDAYGNGYTSGIVAGVDWVTAHAGDIEVANMSLGCACSQPALTAAIAGSVEAGVVYVVAAGNNTINASGFSPANSPDVITVSALADYDGVAGGLAKPSCDNRGPDDTLATFSNYGSTVEVAAPGVCILSTYPGGQYVEASGTSMASPQVAGAAAILAMQSKPTSKADVETIRSTIVESGNQGWTDTSTDGIQEPLLDVSDEAVFGVSDTPRATTQEADEVEVESATLHGTVNPSGHATTYQFEYGLTTEYGTSAPVSPASAGSGNSDVAVSATVELLPGATYHYRLVATSAEGVSRGSDAQLTTLSGETLKLVTTVGSTGSGNGQLNDPRGVATDAAGNVWVVDSGNDRLQKFGPQGKYLATVGSQGTGNGQFNEPRGIDIDADGDIWVTDSGNNRVQVFNSKGAYLGQFGSYGSGNGQFAGPYGIYVDEFGGVWVVDRGNNRVQKFNYKGEYQSKFGSYGTGTGKFVAPTGIALAANNTLWVVDSGNSRVQRFSLSGGYSGPTFGTWGSKPGEISSYQEGGIATDSNGEIWLAESTNSRIQQFEYLGEYKGQFGSAGSNPGQFNGAYGIAVDSAGGFWVTDGNDRLQHWSLGATGIAPSSVTTEAATGVMTHWATLHGAANANGYDTTVYFEYGPTTSYGSKVAKGIGSGKSSASASFFVEGLEPSTTYHYRAVAVNAGGSVAGEDHTFTTDPGTPVVEEVSSTGAKAHQVTIQAKIVPNGYTTTYQYEYGTTTSYGSKAPAVAKNIGNEVTFVPVEDVLTGLEAGTTYHYRVTATNSFGTTKGPDNEFTTLGGSPEFEFSVGYPGFGGAGFWGESPSALTVDGAGNVVVVDPYGNTIRRFDGEGKFLNEFTAWKSGIGYMDPWAVAVDAGGTIWVTDGTNNRVWKLNAKGEVLGTFGSEGSGNGQFMGPTGIAIDGSGHLWVTDAANGRVQEFNAKGEYLSQFGEYGYEEDQLYSPLSLAIDSEGDLWVTDYGLGAKQFSPTGEYLGSVGEGGSSGVAIDGEDNVWIVEAAGNMVMEYTPAGEFVQSFGETGSGPGQFSMGYAAPNLAIDAGGNFWVADPGNHRFQKWG